MVFLKKTARSEKLLFVPINQTLVIITVIFILGSLFFFFWSLADYCRENGGGIFGLDCPIFLST